jgi:hypothetical protein
MTLPDMAARAVTERLRLAARLADLRTGRRCAAKADMSSRGVTSRLREVEALRRLCVRLASIGAGMRGAAKGGGRPG